MFVKNTLSSVKQKIISRYIIDENSEAESKSTNINVLLNRVKQDQKKRKQKKTIIHSIYIFGSSFIWCFNFLENFYN